MEIQTSQQLLPSRQNAVYDLLKYVQPGLLVDVGAAAGHFTKLMLTKSPESNVMAFEPFPGHWPFFYSTMGNDPRATLVKKAVADHSNSMCFHVASVVSGVETNWEHMKGYSSVGKLIPNRSKSDQAIRVECVTIDDHISDQHVRFMKVDVQGGEVGVIKGARRAFTQNRVDMMFIEFSGERELIKFFKRYDLSVYDSEYLVIPQKDRVDLSNWTLDHEVQLSTGKIAYRAWPTDRPTDPAKYCKFLQKERRRIGNVQTDLIVVSREYETTFKEAADCARRGSET